MPALDDTIGGATSTSYADVAFADDYFDNRLHASAWSGASGDDKIRALNMATRELDARTIWHGLQTSTTQALDWPMTGLVDKNGVGIDDNELPSELKNATCEYALVLIGVDTTAPSDTAGIKSLKVDVIELEFDKSDRLAAIPSRVFAQIALWGTTKGGTIEMVRG